MIDELRKEIEIKSTEIKKLEEDAKKYRNEIVLKQQRGRTLNEELARIEQTIKNLRQDISLTERRIYKKGLEIETLILEISEKEYSIKKLRGGLASLIQLFAKFEQESPLEILFKYRFTSAFFERIENTLLVNQKLVSGLEAVKVLRGILETKRAEAEERREELENLGQSMLDQRKIQENVQQNRKELIRITKNEEKLYQNLLKETERRQDEILQKIEELEEDLRKLVDPSSLPKGRNGFLLMPVDGVVSQKYGETPFTKSKRGRHFYKFHNGIDVSSPVGTPIKAAEDGTVLAVGDSDKFCPRGAYGKYIVIDHKNNLTTMYAHLSLVKVETRQEVKRGDIIGYIGNTGLSTGSHLHFTLYDSRTVEIKLGKVGICGPLPFGGSINPMVYL